MFEKFSHIKSKNKLYLLLLFLLIFPSKSYAYLDPGSSSIIIQAMLFLAVILSGISQKIKKIFSKFLSLFIVKKKNKKNDNL